MTRPLGRRRVLAAWSLGLAALAGCAGAPDSGATSATDGTASPDRTTTDGGEPASPGSDPTADATASDTPEGTTAAATDATLDLREANVTAVAVEAVEGGYRFDVTLYHDDDGETGYADWWQVESYAGERLGRRDLLHAHGTREFTRSETVSVPDGTRCVVVRGHDQTHGYGGQAMLVDLETGTSRVLRQGPEPESTAAAPCPIPSAE